VCVCVCSVCVCVCVLCVCVCVFLCVCGRLNGCCGNGNLTVCYAAIKREWSVCDCVCSSNCMFSVAPVVVVECPSISECTIIWIECVCVRVCVCVCVCLHTENYVEKKAEAERASVCVCVCVLWCVCVCVFLPVYTMLINKCLCRTCPILLSANRPFC